MLCPLIHKRCSHAALLCILLLASLHLSFSPTESRDEIESRIIGSAIQKFSPILGITQRIVFSIVPEDSHLVSVKHENGLTQGYRLSFSERFLQSLSEREITAAVAHELGHVWIYTHFPFLQTEALANRQALRLVSKGDLESIYRKIWDWNGRKVGIAEALKPVEDAIGEGSIVPATALRDKILNTAAPIVYLKSKRSGSTDSGHAKGENRSVGSVH